jgi:hypothetical protein
MHPRPLAKTLLVLAAMVGLGSACGSDGRFDDIAKRPKVWPKPTEPPPASPVYRDVAERAPAEQDIERDARGRPARLEAAIERALLAGDALQRETVFVYLVPELLQVAPRRLVDLHARLAGDARGLLGSEIARQWASSDARAAVGWMKGLEERERRALAMLVVEDLAPWTPGVARSLADELGIAGEAQIRKLLSVRN